MISVIVPVYNVEKYLKDCIESILNQTYTNFEVILVDDGSPDRCGEICDQFAQKDKRVKVIHKPNGGQNSAIKAGLEKSQGKYIAFVDSDDWLELDALENLYNCMETNNADLVVGNAFSNGDSQEELSLYYCKKGLYDKQDIKEKLFPNLLTRMNQPMPSFAPARWGKLFKKDLLMQVLHYCDDDIRRGEEKLLTYPYIIKCERIAIIDVRTYHYRYNTESISHSFRLNRMEEQKRLIQLLRFAIGELTDYDFTNQIEAMSIQAVDMTIGELRYQMSSNDKKMIYDTFKKAVKDEIVSKKFHPFPRRLSEHIKFHLIMHRCVIFLWVYNKFFSVIKYKLSHRK